MSAKWDNLPSEILEQILDYSDLHKKPLHISLVCRKWNAIARMLYYKHMLFDYEEVEDVISFIMHLRRYPSIGELVKILDFDDLLVDFDMNGSIIMLPLLTMCPNVTEVYVTNMPAYFWGAMMYVQEEGFAQHIKALAFRGDPAPMPGYHANAIMYKVGPRNFFWSHIAGYKLPDPAFDEMITYLPKHLAQRSGPLGAVQLRCYSNAFAYQALEDALENCRESLPAVRLRIANNQLMGGLPTLDLSNITKQPATKELTIFTHRITPADMKYLMYKFTNLKELEIWFPALQDAFVWNEMTAKRWHSVDMTGRFFKYLSTIPEIHIASLNLPLKDIDDYLSHFVQHMDALNLELVYPMFKTYDKAQLGLTKRNSMAEQYNYEEGEKGTLKTVLSIQSRTLQSSLYFTRLLQIFHNTTKILTLSVEKNYDPHRTQTEDDAARGSKLGGTLDSILTHFHQLKRLHVKNIVISPFPDFDEGIPDEDEEDDDRLSLDVFKFTRSTIHATALPQLSRRLQYVRNLQFVNGTHYYMRKDQKQGLDLDYYIYMPFTRIHTIHFGSEGIHDSFIIKVKILSLSKVVYMMGNIASAGVLTKETFLELADQRNHRDVPRKIVVIECQHLVVFKTDRWEADVLENLESDSDSSDYDVNFDLEDVD